MTMFSYMTSNNACGGYRDYYYSLTHDISFYSYCVLLYRYYYVFLK